jgi:hypothetical protein
MKSRAKTNDRPKRKHIKKPIIDELEEWEEPEESEKSKIEQEEQEEQEDQEEQESKKPEDDLNKERYKLIKHKSTDEKQFNELNEEPKKHIKLNPPIFTNITCDEIISQHQSQPMSQQSYPTTTFQQPDEYTPPFMTQQQTQMLQIQQQQFQMLQQQQQLLQQLQMATQHTPHQMTTPQQQTVPLQPPEAIPLIPRMTPMQQYIRDQLPHPSLFYNQGVPTYDKKNTKVVCFTIDENGDIRSVREFHHQE